MKKYLKVLFLAIIMMAGINSVDAAQAFKVCRYAEYDGEELDYEIKVEYALEEVAGGYTDYLHTTIIGTYWNEEVLNSSVALVKVPFDGVDTFKCPEYALFVNDPVWDNAYTSDSLSELEDIVADKHSNADYKIISLLEVEDADLSKLKKFEIIEGDKVACGDVELPVALTTFSSNLFNILKLLVPIILVIAGSISFARVVVSGDDKAGSEARSAFIRRIVASLILFLVVQLTQIGLSIGDAYDDKLDSCVNVILNGVDEENTIKKQEVISFDSGGFYCSPTSSIRVGNKDLDETVVEGDVTKCTYFTGGTYKCQDFNCRNTALNPSNENYICTELDDYQTSKVDISENVKEGKVIRCGTSQTYGYECHTYECSSK